MKNYKTLAALAKAYEKGELTKKQKLVIANNDADEFMISLPGEEEEDEDGNTEPGEPVWESSVEEALREALKMLKIPVEAAE